MRLRLGWWRWVAEERIVGLVGGLFVSFVPSSVSSLGLLLLGFMKRGWDASGKGKQLKGFIGHLNFPVVRKGNTCGKFVLYYYNSPLSPCFLL